MCIVLNKKVPIVQSSVFTVKRYVRIEGQSGVSVIVDVCYVLRCPLSVVVLWQRLVTCPDAIRKMKSRPIHSTRISEC